MFSLAIDFFDEFGLERLADTEKPLNEMSSAPLIKDGASY